MHTDPEKVARLDEYLAGTDCEAVWFARPSNFAWLTGASNVVDREARVGVAAAGYDGFFHVLTSNNEAPRFRNEVLDDVPVETFPWYEQSLAEAIAERSSTPFEADFEVPDAERVAATRLRTPLTEPDIERYRALGHEAAIVLEDVCRTVERSDSERSVAARLEEELSTRGIDTPVLLVGGEERAPNYRHFPPTEAEIGGYALVSITAQRDGLHASATRTIALDPPDWLATRHEAAMQVEAAAIAATQRLAEEGGTASDVFRAMQDAYAAVGHPDEWARHHQGGATGFAGREWKATPDGDAAIEAPMAYAWNPTVQGAKSEDTVLIDDGLETLTATGDWPTHEIDVDDETIVRHDLGP
ncbi:M24 family metallopeptidase [Halococcus thailandensis]|uniref:Xaa-Pro aminopeptidase n=1 Tax=Halococcus thailandensis JCM 13552 TaxID=1227457 RepID=M0N0X6_9EURY|nr:M24 family metallopeptidase [Halococcus thailandensis]EMA51208.1 Xaa-Pro aminopeptidase [Halococcus thailandensis JCM 13552]